MATSPILTFPRVRGKEKDSDMEFSETLVRREFYTFLPRLRGD